MKIAYLAPEIPALSATFVYNEILALEENGNRIVSVSVHRPHAEATEAAITELKKKVHYLYQSGKGKVLAAHLKLLFTHPVSYLKAWGLLFKDMSKLGLFSRAAAGLGYRFFYAAELARILLAEQVEHLHVHFAHVPTDIAMYASAMSGIGFSVTAHANDIFERGWLLPEKVARSRFFATISQFNQRYLVDDKKVDKEKLRIIRCGVDTRVFSPKGFKSIKAPVKIGVVGRLVEKKGIDTLIDAMQLLVEQQLNATLEIAGSGPLETMLKDKVVQAGLQEVVMFIGAVPHTEVASFVSSLDLFVLPCKRDSHGDMDGIPVVLMEAMMSGVPVISTDISGVPELVINQQTGLAVAPDNAQELAAAIVSMCKDEAFQQAVITRAEQKVREEFSLLVNANRLNELFHQAIAVD